MDNFLDKYKDVDLDSLSYEDCQVSLRELSDLKIQFILAHSDPMSLEYAVGRLMERNITEMQECLQKRMALLRQAHYADIRRKAGCDKFNEWMNGTGMVPDKAQVILVSALSDIMKDRILAGSTAWDSICRSALVDIFSIGYTWWDFPMVDMALRMGVLYSNDIQ